MQSAKSPELNNFELDTCPISVAIDQPSIASCKHDVSMMQLYVCEACTFIFYTLYTY